MSSREFNMVLFFCLGSHRVDEHVELTFGMDAARGVWSVPYGYYLFCD